jgi:hypothetical protein
MSNHIPSFDEYLNETEDRRTPEEKTKDAIDALKLSIDKIQDSFKTKPEKIPVFKVQIEVLNAKMNVLKLQDKLRKTQKAFTK